jgi:hypothetical protein
VVVVEKREGRERDCAAAHAAAEEGEKPEPRDVELKAVLNSHT